VDGKVLFEYEFFNEDDDAWGALFVRIHDQWRMAQPLFGTEDKDEILKQINEGRK